MGSLDDKSSIDKSFLKSLGTGTGETKITLVTDTSRFSATLTGSAKLFIKTPAAGFPPLRFLRRSQIIKLMDAQATGRYETLKDYIDVSGIYESEEELRKAVRDIGQNLNTSVSNLQLAHDTLEQIWIKEDKPEGDYLAWAKKQSEADVSKDQKDLQTLNELLNQFRAIDIKHKEMIQAKANAKSSLQTKQNAEKALKVLQVANSKINTSLLALLQEAKTYISGQEQIDKCPVCSYDIKKATVIASLDKQIKSMDALEKATNQLSTATKAHDRNIAIYGKAVETVSTLLVKFKNSIKGYKTKVTEIAPFVDGIGADVAANYNCYIQNLTELQALNYKIDTAQKKKNKNIQQHNSIKQNYKAITENSQKVGRLTALQTASTKALAIVEKERKDFYDSELLSISSEIEQMYQKLHPNEGLGGIKLFLNPKFKKSLELHANFHTEQGMTPQSVYSESHLDTLGICIFLSLAKKYSDGSTILILDDVVMSVDESHLNRFIELLHGEADNFAQIIITTHYRPWRDRYRTNRAPSGKVHFIELRKWSKDTGIRVQNGRIELQELELALNDNTYLDRQAIASKSGVILENLLDFLTDIYEYHMPKRKSLKYTLGELIDTLQPKYLKNIKAIHTSKQINKDGNEEVIEVEYPLQPIIDELKKLLFIRNQVGAHFTLDEDASDDDVELFGKKTLELGTVLVCSQTGQLPLSKAVDHWKSKSGTIKLYPSEKI
ncbi:MAG TPA: hypothetical protein PLS00_01495 [Niabella sp.]|nr:hypothetical protein [Niabella sp.]